MYSKYRYFEGLSFQMFYLGPNGITKKEAERK